MRQFVLRVSSYSNTVAGASHFRGRVEGAHPRSCHGGTYYSAPGSRGKTICAEGHILPERVQWEVEDRWAEKRYDRWALQGYDGPGPAQFGDVLSVVRAAVSRFSGLWPLRRFYDDNAVPGEPGDELWYGQIDRAEKHEGQYRETDLYGLIIWRIHEHTVEWRDGKPAVIPDEDVAGTWARLDAIRVGADDW